MDILFWIVIALVGLVLLPFILGPVLVKTTQRLPAKPRFEHIDPNEGLSSEVYELFKASLGPMQEIGFTEQVFLRQDEQMPGQTVNLCALTNPQTHDMGMVVHMMQQVEAGKPIKVPYVEYFTRYEDETSVTTNNNDEIMPFPKQEGRRTTQVPEIKDPKRVHEIHRVLMGVDQHGPIKPAPMADGLEATVIESMVKEFETQIGTGYLVLDPGGECFRPTWKGAILMTWKLCWPVSAIVRSLRKSATASLLRKLGVNQG